MAEITKMWIAGKMRELMKYKPIDKIRGTEICGTDMCEAGFYETGFCGTGNVGYWLIGREQHE